MFSFYFFILLNAIYKGARISNVHCEFGGKIRSSDGDKY